MRENAWHAQHSEMNGGMSVAALALLLLVRARIRDEVPSVGRIAVAHALLLGELAGITVLARVIAGAFRVLARRTLGKRGQYASL